MTNRLTVVVDQAVAARLAELDVLVDGHRFDDFELQAGALDRRLQRIDLVHGPDFAHRFVVNGGHDMRDARDLADVVQRDRIGLAVPTE